MFIWIPPLGFLLLWILGMLEDLIFLKILNNYLDKWQWLNQMENLSHKLCSIHKDIKRQKDWPERLCLYLNFVMISFQVNLTTISDLGLWNVF